MSVERPPSLFAGVQEPDAGPPPDPRRELIGAARELCARGLTVSSLGNASVRAGSRIWITPTRVVAAELEDAQIVALDLSGARRGGGVPSCELPLHLEIYRRWPRTGAVVHTHSPCAVAWSHRGLALSHPTEELRYHGLSCIPCAAPAPAATAELARAAAEALRHGPVALLASHGVVARAASLRHAIELCALAEQQARIEWLLLVVAALGDGPSAARPGVHPQAARGAAQT